MAYRRRTTPKRSGSSNSGRGSAEKETPRRRNSSDDKEKTSRGSGSAEKTTAKETPRKRNSSEDKEKMSRGTGSAESMFRASGSAEKTTAKETPRKRNSSDDKEKTSRGSGSSEKPTATDTPRKRNSSEDKEKMSRATGSAEKTSRGSGSAEKTTAKETPRKKKDNPDDDRVRRNRNLPLKKPMRRIRDSCEAINRYKSVNTEIVVHGKNRKKNSDDEDMKFERKFKKKKPTKQEKLMNQEMIVRFWRQMTPGDLMSTQKTEVAVDPWELSLEELEKRNVYFMERKTNTNTVVTMFQQISNDDYQKKLREHINFKLDDLLHANRPVGSAATQKPSKINFAEKVQRRTFSVLRYNVVSTDNYQISDQPQKKISESSLYGNDQKQAKNKEKPSEDQANSLMRKRGHA